MNAGKGNRRRMREAPDYETDEAWIKRQLAKVPPPTRKQWEAANAALGIVVTPQGPTGPSRKPPLKTERSRDATQRNVSEPAAPAGTSSPDGGSIREEISTLPVSLSQAAVKLLETTMESPNAVDRHHRALAYAVLAVAEELRQLRDVVAGAQDAPSLPSHPSPGGDPSVAAESHACGDDHG